MYRFTEDCMIGIEQIDEEHRKLFRLLNEAMEHTLEGGAGSVMGRKLLKELKDYAKTHFAHEEAYMEQIKDGELPRQRKEHAQFIEKMNSYGESEMTEEESAQVAHELLPFMAKWLYHHILGSDIMIGKLTEAAKAKAEEGEEDIFAFTDEYKTGIVLVDEEHKGLFEIIRETRDVIGEELVHDKYDLIINILDELREYTIMHFQDEEKYMEEIGYEGLKAQRLAHEAFVERLNEINLLEIDEGQKEYLEELLAFLLNWLTNHILKMDKRIPVK